MTQILEDERQVLPTVYGSGERDLNGCKTAKLPENMPKNRSIDILACKRLHSIVHS